MWTPPRRGPSTNPLTHIKRGFMLCILYVRNGDRYGGLRICAGEHRWSISSRPISRAKSSKMRKDISGEDQRSSVGPQAANAADDGSRKAGRVGRHQARSIGEVDTRPPESTGDDWGKRSRLQIVERHLGG